MKIYTYEADAGEIQSSLICELQRIISLAGASIPFELVAVSRIQAQEIEKWNGTSDFCEHVLDIFGWDSTGYRLLISAGERSTFKQYCLSIKHHAHWGIQFSHVAVEYVSRDLKLLAQIHECLHFFDVNDCYVEDDPNHPAKSSCKNSRCLMRYGVNSNEVCEDVYRQLRAKPLACGGCTDAA